jgi:hypothetical protein
LTVMCDAVQGESIARVAAFPNAWDCTGAKTLQGLICPPTAACCGWRMGPGRG